MQYNRGYVNGYHLVDVQKKYLDLGANLDFFAKKNNKNLSVYLCVDMQKIQLYLGAILDFFEFDELLIFF